MQLNHRPLLQYSCAILAALLVVPPAVWAQSAGDDCQPVTRDGAMRLQRALDDVGQPEPSPWSVGTPPLPIAVRTQLDRAEHLLAELEREANSHNVPALDLDEAQATLARAARAIEQQLARSETHAESLPRVEAALARYYAGDGPLVRFHRLYARRHYEMEARRRGSSDADFSDLDDLFVDVSVAPVRAGQLAGEWLGQVAPDDLREARRSRLHFNSAVLRGVDEQALGALSNKPSFLNLTALVLSHEQIDNYTRLDLLTDDGGRTPCVPRELQNRYLSLRHPERVADYRRWRNTEDSYRLQLSQAIEPTLRGTGALTTEELVDVLGQTAPTVRYLPAANKREVARILVRAEQRHAPARFQRLLALTGAPLSLLTPEARNARLAALVGEARAWVLAEGTQPKDRKQQFNTLVPHLDAYARRVASRLQAGDVPAPAPLRYGSGRKRFVDGMVGASLEMAELADQARYQPWGLTRGAAVMPTLVWMVRRDALVRMHQLDERYDNSGSKLSESIDTVLNDPRTSFEEKQDAFLDLLDETVPPDRSILTGVGHLLGLSLAELPVLRNSFTTRGTDVLRNHGLAGARVGYRSLPRVLEDLYRRSTNRRALRDGWRQLESRMPPRRRAALRDAGRDLGVFASPPSIDRVIAYGTQQQEALEKTITAALSGAPFLGQKIPGNDDKPLYEMVREVDQGWDWLYRDSGNITTVNRDLLYRWMGPDRAETVITAILNDVHGVMKPIAEHRMYSELRSREFDRQPLFAPSTPVASLILQVERDLAQVEAGTWDKNWRPRPLITWEGEVDRSALRYYVPLEHQDYVESKLQEALDAIRADFKRRRDHEIMHRLDPFSARLQPFGGGNDVRGLGGFRGDLDSVRRSLETLFGDPRRALPSRDDTTSTRPRVLSDLHDPTPWLAERNPRGGRHWGMWERLIAAADVADEVHTSFTLPPSALLHLDDANDDPGGKNRLRLAAVSEDPQWGFIRQRVSARPVIRALRSTLAKDGYLASWGAPDEDETNDRLSETARLAIRWARVSDQTLPGYFEWPLRRLGESYRELHTAREDEVDRNTSWTSALFGSSYSHLDADDMAQASVDRDITFDDQLWGYWLDVNKQRIHPPVEIQPGYGAYADYSSGPSAPVKRSPEEQVEILLARTLMLASWARPEEGWPKVDHRFGGYDPLSSAMRAARQLPTPAKIRESMAELRDAAARLDQLADRGRANPSEGNLLSWVRPDENIPQWRRERLHSFAAERREDIDALERQLIDDVAQLDRLKSVWADAANARNSDEYRSLRDYLQQNLDLPHLGEVLARYRQINREARARRYPFVPAKRIPKMHERATKYRTFYDLHRRNVRRIQTAMVEAAIEARMNDICRSLDKVAEFTRDEELQKLADASGAMRAVLDRFPHFTYEALKALEELNSKPLAQQITEWLTMAAMVASVVLMFVPGGQAVAAPVFAVLWPTLFAASAAWGIRDMRVLQARKDFVDSLGTGTVDGRLAVPLNESDELGDEIWWTKVWIALDAAFAVFEGGQSIRFFRNMAKQRAAWKVLEAELGARPGIDPSALRAAYDDLARQAAGGDAAAAERFSRVQQALRDLGIDPGAAAAGSTAGSADDAYEEAWDFMNEQAQKLNEEMLAAGETPLEIPTAGMRGSEEARSLWNRIYRKLAKKYHPDRNPGDADAEAMFKRVQEAMERLTG